MYTGVYTLCVYLYTGIHERYQGNTVLNHATTGDAFGMGTYASDNALHGNSVTPCTEMVIWLLWYDFLTTV